MKRVWFFISFILPVILSLFLTACVSNHYVVHVYQNNNHSQPKIFTNPFTEQKIHHLLEKQQNLHFADMSQKVAMLSQAFVGTNYVENTLIGSIYNQEQLVSDFTIAIPIWIMSMPCPKQIRMNPI